ncbi:MAG: class II aldolase/adducin family protein, partial [Clostridia bacterium]|nr:class II aldolase/adducin family protein [Clostridia bacterium]
DIVRVPFGTPFTNPKSISDKIGERTPVVLVENDCIITTGNSLIKAFDRLEVAEFTANTIINAQKVGTIQAISDEEIETINKAFNLK